MCVCVRAFGTILAKQHSLIFVFHLLAWHHAIQVGNEGRGRVQEALERESYSTLCWEAKKEPKYPFINILQ